MDLVNRVMCFSMDENHGILERVCGDGRYDDWKRNHNVRYRGFRYPRRITDTR